MKILMTSDTYFPRLGGGEHHVHYLLKELKAAGHDVTLLTTECGRDERDASLGVRREAYRGWLSLFSLFSSLWRASAAVDLIHSHCSYRLAWIASIVAKMRGIPFVLTQHGHGLLPEAGARYPWVIAFKIWRCASMQRATIIISTSDDLSIDIRALGFGKKIVAIANGYDAELFRTSPPATSWPPVLLTVRRLVPKTGVQYLIAALPLLRRRHPDLRCIVIGEGRLREKLLALVRELQVQDMVTFLGALPQTELPSHYARAHIVVLPSTAESTSLTCIEAMASGRSIVASRVGGLVELLGEKEERGYLVTLTEDAHSNYDAPFTLPPARIQALADAVTHVLTHAPEARRKAEAAAEYARSHFPWSHITQRTVEEVYKKVQ